MITSATTERVAGNPQPSRRAPRGFVAHYARQFGTFAGLVGLCVVLWILTPHFLTVSNLLNVAQQTSINAIIAVGLTFVIISGGIDLAVGSTIALTGVVTALAINAGLPPSAALLSGILVGGLVGVVNGLVITRLKVVPFIATLGMLGVARGVAKWLANQQTVNMPGTWLNELLVMFPNPSWLLVAPGVWISIFLAIVAAIVLRNTVFGRRVFALGSNEAAARACGIATDRLKVWIYGLAGLLFGLAGVMQMSRLRQGDPTVAAGSMRAVGSMPGVRCAGRCRTCAANANHAYGCSQTTTEVAGRRAAWSAAESTTAPARVVATALR